MQRVAINGCSGAGKSTLARQLSAVLDLPYVEIDGLQHGPNWQPRPTFVEDVHRVVAGERWVIEYQYDAARPMILDRADTLVWLDLPRRVTMWRVVRRTVSRRLRRTELWNGNREGPLWRVLVDDEHIVRWAWRTSTWPARRVAQIRRDRPELPIVRLRSAREVRTWVASLSGRGTPAPPR
jgi:adenylate kinase family enzyme